MPTLSEVLQLGLPAACQASHTAGPGPLQVVWPRVATSECTHPPACLPALFSGQAPAAAHVGCSWAALHAHQDCLPRSVDGQALGRVPNFRLVFLKERLQRLDEGGQVLIHQRIGGGGGLQGRVWVLA